MPTELLPQKSIVTPKPAPRRELQYLKPQEPVKAIKYACLDDIKKDIRFIKDPWQIIRKCDEYWYVVKLSENADIEIKVKIDSSFGLSVKGLSCQWIILYTKRI